LQKAEISNNLFRNIFHLQLSSAACHSLSHYTHARVDLFPLHLQQEIAVVGDVWEKRRLPASLDALAWVSVALRKLVVAGSWLARVFAQ
jgi:hypothetical protein